MKGKILLGVAVLIVIGLFLSGYLNSSTVNSAIETAVGVKTVSLDELKQMVEEGKIPYEVYRLALYRKLENPSIVYKVMGNKVYQFLNGCSGLLEGRYVERINDTWLRIIIVDYDDLFADRYYSVKVDVSTELKSGYVVDGWWPSYLKFINETEGSWSYNSTWDEHYSGRVKIRYYLNPNAEDVRVSKTIAEQVLEYGNENRLTKTQTIQLVYDRLVRSAVDYVPDNSWIGKPFTINVLDGDKLFSLNVSKSDSLMKSFLLYGRGSCYAQDTFVIYVLNWMGVKAGEFVCENPLGGWHGFVAIPMYYIHLKELHIPSGIQNVPIRPLVIKLNNTKEEFVAYSITSPFYGPAGANEKVTSGFRHYIFK
ncbi:hypothetical protein DRP05_09980 [Archaeoglobales archaeon]|nr:MAG: hypothetical protein DRP05_09980 [Archaeoglobales archaeon]